MTDRAQRCRDAIREAERRGMLRPEVAAFALLMEQQLQANDHKPGWKGDHGRALVNRLGEECAELSEAVDMHDAGIGDTTSLGKEAADVANFAMMIADVYGAIRTEAETPKGGE